MNKLLNIALKKILLLYFISLCANLTQPEKKHNRIGPTWIIPVMQLDFLQNVVSSTQ